MMILKNNGVKQNGPSSVYNDNSSTLQPVYQEKHHMRSKL